MKYCRYCAYCILGDCYYCNFHEKVLPRIDKPTSCREFVLSELGDVETGKPYKPRERCGKHTVSLQTSLFDKTNEGR